MSASAADLFVKLLLKYLDSPKAKLKRICFLQDDCEPSEVSNPINNNLRMVVRLRQSLYLAIIAGDLSTSPWRRGRRLNNSSSIGDNPWHFRIANWCSKLGCVTSCFNWCGNHPRYEFGSHELLSLAPPFISPVLASVRVALGGLLHTLRRAILHSSSRCGKTLYLKSRLSTQC
jgi:hypothetical protein